MRTQGNNHRLLDSCRLGTILLVLCSILMLCSCGNSKELNTDAGKENPDSRTESIESLENALDENSTEALSDASLDSSIDGQNVGSAAVEGPYQELFDLLAQYNYRSVYGVNAGTDAVHMRNEDMNIYPDGSFSGKYYLREQASPFEGSLEASNKYSGHFTVQETDNEFVYHLFFEDIAYETDVDTWEKTLGNTYGYFESIFFKNNEFITLYTPGMSITDIPERVFDACSTSFAEGGVLGYPVVMNENVGIAFQSDTIENLETQLAAIEKRFEDIGMEGLFYRFDGEDYHTIEFYHDSNGTWTITPYDPSNGIWSRDFKNYDFLWDEEYIDCYTESYKLPYEKTEDGFILYLDKEQDKFLTFQRAGEEVVGSMTPIPLNPYREGTYHCVVEEIWDATENTYQWVVNVQLFLDDVFDKTQMEKLVPGQLIYVDNRLIEVETVEFNENRIDINVGQEDKELSFVWKDSMGYYIAESDKDEVTTYRHFKYYTVCINNETYFCDRTSGEDVYYYGYDLIDRMNEIGFYPPSATKVIIGEDGYHAVGFIREKID